MVDHGPWLEYAQFYGSKLIDCESGRTIELGGVYMYGVLGGLIDAYILWVFVFCNTAKFQYEKIERFKENEILGFVMKCNAR